MAYLGVLLAAVAGYGMGAIWYMVNAKRWMAAAGLNEEAIKENKSPTPFIIAFVASVLTAGMMRHIFVSSGVSGLGGGLVAGFGIGVFLIAPWIATNYAFAGRPKSLWLIDCAHVILAASAIGAVLGAFF